MIPEEAVNSKQAKIGRLGKCGDIISKGAFKIVWIPAAKDQRDTMVGLLLEVGREFFCGHIEI